MLYHQKYKGWAQEIKKVQEMKPTTILLLTFLYIFLYNNQWPVWFQAEDTSQIWRYFWTVSIK